MPVPASVILNIIIILYYNNYIIIIQEGKNIRMQKKAGDRFKSNLEKYFLLLLPTIVFMEIILKHLICKDCNCDKVRFN